MTSRAAVHGQTTSGFALGAVARLHRAPHPRALTPARWLRVRVATDVVVLAVAAAAAALSANRLHVGSTNIAVSIAFAALMLLMMSLRRAPDDRLSGGPLAAAAHVVKTASVVATIVLALAYAFDARHLLPLVVRLWVYSSVYLGVARAELRSYRRHVTFAGTGAVPALIVGAGVVGGHLARRLQSSPEYGVVPVGLIDASPLGDAAATVGHTVPVLGGPDGLLEAVEQTGARRVIVAFTSDPDAALVSQLETCRTRGLEVSLVPRLFELINERSWFDHVGGVPLVTIRPTDPHGWQFAVKHAIDRVLAAAGLMALAPLFLAAACAVRLSSPGPVFFRQRRIGQDGREFDLLKFRTMTCDPTPAPFELPRGLAPGGVEGADRRTPIGRALRSSSLDELPQLINVLRGEMSLIGPRPERPEFVSRFKTEVSRYEGRHRVKSGITGWAQVCGLRGQTSIEDRVEWDNFYIQNWSLLLDLRILALTVVEVLRFRG